MTQSRASVPDFSGATVDALTPMSLDAFRAAGKEMVDFIADYWQSLLGENPPPVLSQVKPGDLLAVLPSQAPEAAEPWSVIHADVTQHIMPGITHWQHPSFFAYFPANASPAAVLGEFLSAGLGVNGMLWATSPACTELEMRVLDWLARLVGLPARFMHEPSANECGGDAIAAPVGGSVIMSTASEGTLVALVAARNRLRTRQPDHARKPMVLYTSTQAHSSVIKAAMIAGLCAGPDPVTETAALGPGVITPAPDGSFVRLIETDANSNIRTDLLEQAIRADIAAGRVPIMIAGTIGTTGAMGVDDIAELSRIASDSGAWLHIDAAFAGCAMICPELREQLVGNGVALSRIDSFGFNPHKWLLTNFDCHCFYVSDRAALTAALSITPEYLRTSAAATGQVIDYRDWQIPLGRRFRALKLWFVLRSFGAAALRDYIRGHVRMAARFESLITTEARFEIPSPRVLSLVCFRLKPLSGQTASKCNADNRSLLEALNASGKLQITQTLLPQLQSDQGPRLALRLAVGGSFTREADIDRAWTEIKAAADRQRPH